MENVLLVGESGMGKTKVIRKFERTNAVKYDADAGLKPRPVVVVTMPPEPTEDQLYSSLLGILGVPVVSPAQLRTERKREIAIATLRQIGTKVLVIDEINSILAGTARQQRLFLQLLRFLSNDLRMALVCAGIPEARHALMSDTQLRSRFTEIELPIWQADDALQAFINRVVAGMPLRLPSPVASLRVRQLLAERSGGITHFICKALEHAALNAIQTGREMIDYDALADAATWKRISPVAGFASRVLPFIAARA
jgi:type II secretory pathway predicted ATPase ExeA